MKMEKKYVALIAVIIILVFLFAFSYFYEFTPTTITIEPTNTVNNGAQNSSNNVQVPPEVIAAQKTFSFVYVTCTVSNGVDTVKFEIQTGNSTIGIGEMSAFLDQAGEPFKTYQGTEINAIRVNANSISDELSYTASDHKDSRTLMVSSPAGTLQQSVTCS
jgi:hypothetical protein